MFIVAQFPLADLRPFVAAETRRLKVPVWPLPTPRAEFVRCYGPVEKRRKGGIVEWSGEEVYSRAGRAIRFPAVTIAPGSPKAPPVPVRCVFRRFFSDGEAVARVEVGFLTRRHVRVSDEGQFLDVLRQCLALRVAVPTRGGDGAAVTELQAAGRPLAKLYASASTRGGVPAADADPKWIVPGEPLLLVECAPDEAQVLPRRTVIAGSLESLGFELAHYWVHRKELRLHAWVLGTAGPKSELRRRLRLNLLRLHAEQESLRHVLRALAQGTIEVQPGTKASDDLQEYLNRAVTTVERAKRDGVPNREMFQAAADYEDLVSGDQRATLLSELGKMRLNIGNKAKRFAAARSGTEASPTIIENKNGDMYVTYGTLNRSESMSQISVTLGNGVTIHGDFVVANRIANSFNKAAGAAVSDDLKEKLKELSTLMGQANTKLPPDKAEQASKDLETFVNEAVSKTPRKKWYELSAEGLLEAAKAVKDLAAPITSAVTSVLALLA